MDPALLPGHAGHGGLDGVHQGAVMVGDHQLHPAQATDPIRCQHGNCERNAPTVGVSYQDGIVKPGEVEFVQHHRALSPQLHAGCGLVR